MDESEKGRRRRNGPQTAFPNSGHPDLFYLRFIIAGELDTSWSKFGLLGAKPTDLAQLLELSAPRNMETASRREKLQSAARAHLACERGHVEVILDQLVGLNRGRSDQSCHDQKADVLRDSAPAVHPQSRPNDCRDRGRKRQSGGQAPKSLQPARSAPTTHRPKSKAKLLRDPDPSEANRIKDSSSTGLHTMLVF